MESDALFRWVVLELSWIVGPTAGVGKTPAQAGIGYQNLYLLCGYFSKQFLCGFDVTLKLDRRLAAISLRSQNGKLTEKRRSATRKLTPWTINEMGISIHLTHEGEKEWAQTQASWKRRIVSLWVSILKRKLWQMTWRKVPIIRELYKRHKGVASVPVALCFSEN